MLQKVIILLLLVVGGMIALSLGWAWELLVTVGFIVLVLIVWVLDRTRMKRDWEEYRTKHKL